MSLKNRSNQPHDIITNSIFNEAAINDKNKFEGIIDERKGKKILTLPPSNVF